MSSSPLRLPHAQTPPPMPPLRLWRGDSDERPEFAGIPLGQAAPLLVVACFLFAFTSYPTVEGWSFWTDWERESWSAFAGQVKTFPDRPLHTVPSLVAWLCPGDFGAGCMAVGALLTLARGYLLIRLARLNQLGQAASWILLLFGLLQPAWPGCGYERFHAAQTTFVLFLCGLLAACHHARTGSVWWIAAGCLAALAGFMTYQGLFITCFLAGGAFWVAGRKAEARSACLVFVPACGLYVAWYLLANRYFPSSYTNTHAVAKLSTNMANDLRKAFSHAGWISLVGMTAALLCWGILLSKENGRKGWIRLGLLAAAAPLCGIIFYRNRAWLCDPERVMLPVAAWLVVVFAALGSQIRVEWKSCGKVAAACFSVLVVCSLASPLKAMRHVQGQQAILQALNGAPIQWDKKSQVMAVDTSGELGNMYTFLVPNYLGKAWEALGRPGKVWLRKTPRGQGSKHSLPSQPVDEEQEPQPTDILFLRKTRENLIFGDSWEADPQPWSP